MILVDTSVIIDSFKGNKHDKTELFKKILLQGISFGIASYTYQEVLQGARDEIEYEKLKEYLSTQRIYFLPQVAETYEKAASIIFLLKRQGITVRSSIDALIALTAIENDLLLLHNDRDFDAMAEKMPTLQILRQL